MTSRKLCLNNQALWNFEKLVCTLKQHLLSSSTHQILVTTIPLCFMNSALLDSTRYYHTVFVFLWLISFSVIPSESESEVAQSCPTLCDPMYCSLPGFSLHGILQARVLEWVAISFSRGSSQPRYRTQVSRIPGRCYTLSHQGSPVISSRSIYVVKNGSISFFLIDE